MSVNFVVSETVNKGTCTSKCQINSEAKYIYIILALPKSKAFAESNSNVPGGQRYLLKTHWEKADIARNEQFLIFSQCILPCLNFPQF